MKKIILSWQQVESQVQDIIRQMSLNNWRPDYVVGLTRGGLVPANLISQYLDIPMFTLKVSLRNHENCESNEQLKNDAHSGTNILIVDDINDTGATLNWIKHDWDLNNHTNVRVATLYDNESSKSKLDINYTSVTINKAEEDCWIEFPWENWWTK